MSLTVLDEGHYINAIYHDAGTHELTMDEFGSGHVCPVVRIFVDPNDLRAVAELRDQISIGAGSAQPYEHPYFDEESRKRIHTLRLELGGGMPDARRAFGRADQPRRSRHTTQRRRIR